MFISEFLLLQASKTGSFNFEVYFFCGRAKLRSLCLCLFLFGSYLHRFSCVLLKLQRRARVVPLRADDRGAAQRPQHRRRIGRGHIENELLFNCLDISRNFWLCRRLIFFCQAFFLKKSFKTRARRYYYFEVTIRKSKTELYNTTSFLDNGCLIKHNFFHKTGVYNKLLIERF